MAKSRLISLQQGFFQISIFCLSGREESACLSMVKSSEESFDPGRVTIRAQMAHDLLSGVVVACARPRGVASTLLRFAPSEIPAIAGRFFALCGHSQAIAARHAIAVALGQTVEASATELRQLAAERLSEHLRSCLIGWSHAAPPSPLELAAARQALAILQRVLADRQTDVQDIEGHLAVLGIGAAVPADTAWSARLIAAAHDDAFPDIAPDALSPADDPAVIDALARGGDAFAARPSLPGRRPETGAYARAIARGVDLPGSGLSRRMAARLIEMAEACDLLIGRSVEPHPRVSSGAIENGGYAAVETPRGRLYHAVWRNADNALERYLILAPTEWNFASDGPFAHLAAQARLPANSATGSLERLAALFDPCVACDIGMQKADHA